MADLFILIVVCILSVVLLDRINMIGVVLVILLGA